MVKYGKKIGKKVKTGIGTIGEPVVSGMTEEEKKKSLKKKLMGKGSLF